MPTNNNQHFEKYVYILIQKKYIIEVIENNNHNKQILFSYDISYQDLFEILNTIEYCTINIYNPRIPFNKIGILEYVSSEINYGEHIDGNYTIIEFNQELLLVFEEIENLDNMGMLADATQ
jgi:hypothetical protein